jgi:hypothetical protein
MRQLTDDTVIRVKASRPPLTGDTRIRLRQIVDLKDWHDKLIKDFRDKTETGTVRRWSDGKLHEKTNKGWRVLPHYREYNVEQNKHENRKNRKTPKPSDVATQKQFDNFIEDLFNNPNIKEPKAVRLLDLDRKLMKQIGLDKNTSFIFSSRYNHISPARKGQHNQDLRKEEYKEIPNVIKNAKHAYLEKGTGDFKLLFPDKQNPNKVNKIILSKMNQGNFIVTVGKVDKGNAYEPQKTKVVGEGVAPSI